MTGTQPDNDCAVAGAPGFEPGNAGIKIRCLTTWLRPNAAGGPDAPPIAAAPREFNETLYGSNGARACILPWPRSIWRRMPGFNHLVRDWMFESIALPANTSHVSHPAVTEIRGWLFI